MVYDLILASTVNVPEDREPEAPTPVRLQEYCGIILASKEIKREFEHEWVKAYNTWLFKLVDQAELQTTPLPPDATMREARYIYSTFSTNIPMVSLIPGPNALIKLVATLPSFTLQPDTTFPANETEAVADFIESHKVKCLSWWKKDLSLCIGIAQSYKGLTPKTAHNISYWPHELYYTRTTTWVQETLSV
jgi:hypothetical protein